MGPLSHCIACGLLTAVKKTITRNVKTPAGIRKVRPRVCACPVRRKFIRHELRLTTQRSTSTLELIAEAGKLRYQHALQISEICGPMESRGSRLPARNAARLCSRFLLCFAAVHMESAPKISAC